MSGCRDLEAGEGSHSVGDPALHAFQNFLDQAQVVPLGMLPFPEGGGRVAEVIKYRRQTETAMTRKEA